MNQYPKYLIPVIVIILLFGIYRLSTDFSKNTSVLPVKHQLASSEGVDSTLVGWWRFNAGTGTTVVDDSGNGHDATVYGATWTTGKNSNALSFDGSTSYVNISNFDTSPFGVYDPLFTYSAWIYSETSGVEQTIISTVGSWGFSFGKGSNDKITLFAPWSSKINGNTTISTGTWYHVAVTSQGKLYINGVLDVTGEAIPWITGSNGLTIGKIDQASEKYWSGKIDEVRIYSRVLSDSEILSLYNEFNTSSPDNPTTGGGGGSNQGNGPTVDSLGNIQANSASFTDVSAAVSAATVGQTVLIPAGTATWSQSLSITKAIILKGAGTGSTIINGNTNKDTPLISYVPSSPDQTKIMRLSGITFNLNSNSAGIYVANSNRVNPIYIRVDHNEFLNSPSAGNNISSFELMGIIYGSIDNNYLTGSPLFHFDGNQADSWNNLTFNFGVHENIYVEDNIFEVSNTPVAGGWGSRYVARYNTFTFTLPSSTLSPWFDAHGNQGPGVYALMGAEIYGNKITSNDPISSVSAINQRGGKMLGFFNAVNNFYAGYITLWEEYADSIALTTNPQPQHVSESYYFNNLAGGNDMAAVVTIDCKSGLGGFGPDQNCHSLQEDTDYFNRKANFDGSSGIGIGNISSRPNTCTVGTGYWVTNQNYSILSDKTGKNPSNPISGTLYVCGNSNNWIEYYNPYTYPHPFRTNCSLYSGICDFVNNTPSQSTQNNSTSGYSTSNSNSNSNSNIISSGGGFATSPNTVSSLPVTTTLCSQANPSISSSLTTLRYGTKSSSVKELQNQLIQYGYLKAGYNTGYYGNLTLTALNKYKAAQSTFTSSCGTNVTTTTVNPVTPTNTTPTSSRLPSTYRFTTTLKPLTSSINVKNLQIFLNDQGFTVSKSGSGSKGNETNYFGPATKSALIRFQEYYKTDILSPYNLNKGTGYFGVSTMKKVNQILDK